MWIKQTYLAVVNVPAYRPKQLGKPGICRVPGFSLPLNCPPGGSPPFGGLRVDKALRLGYDFVMVGNREDALRATTDTDLFDIHPAVPYNDRRVYVINDVIYKVEKSRGVNWDEWMNYLSLKSVPLPDNVRVPEMTLWELDETTKVIAAEYIKNAPPLMNFIGNAKARRMFDKLQEHLTTITGLCDLHYNNILTRDGLFYLIDLDN